MGSEALPTRTDGQTIDENWFNVLKNTLIQNFLPRNSSGIVTTLAGTLGESAIKWARAYIEVGYWDCGDVKLHHTYNGIVTVGQGWMLCNGNIVNETNYNAIHGAGSWATHIGTSPLEGKHLPAMANKYMTGSNTTTQTGSVALTYVGNAGNTIDLQHLHDSGDYAARFNDSANALWDIRTGMSSWTADKVFTITGASSTSVGGQTTGVDVAGESGNALSSSQSIRPESLAIQYWMRII
jgi:hypothetical protein